MGTNVKNRKTTNTGLAVREDFINNHFEERLPDWSGDLWTIKCHVERVRNLTSEVFTHWFLNKDEPTKGFPEIKKELDSLSKELDRLSDESNRVYQRFMNYTYCDSPDV